MSMNTTTNSDPHKWKCAMQPRRIFNVPALLPLLLFISHAAFAQTASVHHLTGISASVTTSASSDKLLYSTLGQIGKGHLLTILASIKQGEEELAATISLGEGSEEELEEAPLPTEFALKPNYPNPFNPQTTIVFDLPARAKVKLVIYDLLGREVRVLVEGVREAGVHEVVFEANQLPSGTYLYRLETVAGSFVQRMLLVK